MLRTIWFLNNRKNSMIVHVINSLNECEKPFK